MMQDKEPTVLRTSGKAATIKDVAERASVAFSTASYVLNDAPKSISAATRERVWAAARDLGYRPNPAARSLVTKRTHIIALWIVDVASAFSARVIAEVQGQARRHGYEMLISEVHINTPPAGHPSGRPEPAVQQVRQSLWHVDGVITYSGLAYHNLHMASLPARQVPMVCIGTFPVAGADVVGVDLYPGAEGAMRHLVASGCRRIAYLVPDKVDFDGDARHDAYLAVMKEAGQEPVIIALRHNSEAETRAEARAAVAAFLGRHDVMDGLFCFNDECAIGAYRALRDAGLSIPADVSIIGCNGIEDTRYLDCPLSTLVVPIHEMCRTAWDFLEQRIETPDLPVQRIVLPAHLELRESVRP